MRYKIIYNQKQDSFHIKKLEKFLIFFERWKYLGILQGCVAGSYFEPYSFETKEKAVIGLVEYQANEQKTYQELLRRQAKANNHKDIVLTEEDIHDKFPEVFL